MAFVYGKPSKFIVGHLRYNAFIYTALTAFFIFGIFACLVLAILKFGNGGIAKIILTCLYFLALAALTRIMLYVFNLDNFLRGGRAENWVERELSKLPANYLIFRNIHINGHKRDTDFIILGPCGLVTLEVKSHNGEITFDGTRLLKNGKPFNKDFIIQAKREAVDLNNYLAQFGFQGYIKPAIVFTGFFAKMRFGLNAQNGVYVIQKAFLHKFVFSLPHQNLHNFDKIKTVLIELARRSQ